MFQISDGSGDFFIAAKRYAQATACYFADNAERAIADRSFNFFNDFLSKTDNYA
jgi:hypothetical protein